MALFSSLTERLMKTVGHLTGRGRLTEKNIQETLKEIRNALLEADVALPVVKKFIDVIRSKAVGQEIIKSLKPGEALIKIVNEEMTQLMGNTHAELNLKASPPVVIVMVGLQGAGKTTTAAKLALWIKQNLKKTVLLASTDVYRPAAMDQIQTLAGQVGVECYTEATSKDPYKLADNAIAHAKKRLVDIVILDTAGRLHVDEAMMEEVKQIAANTKPTEILFVVDSMTGQDAAFTAKAFNDALSLTGVILTKTDGDARGGAALSIRYITEKPIKFMGVGEKIEDLETFHPDRVASRILGMGDVLSLVEQVERSIDREKAEALAKKVKSGQSFSLNDFKSQLEQMRKMGGLSKLIDKMPGIGGMAQSMDFAVGEQELSRMEAIINSMTRQERRFPDIIKHTRKLRIAKGSGTQVTDVNRLLKNFTHMQKMMKKFQQGGISKMMQRFKGLAIR